MARMGALRSCARARFRAVTRCGLWRDPEVGWRTAFKAQADVPGREHLRGTWGPACRAARAGALGGAPRLRRPRSGSFSDPRETLLATCKRCSCGPQRAASRVSQRRFGIGHVGPGVSSRSFNGLIVRQRLRWPGRRAFLSGRSVPATREHPSCGSSDPCRAGPPLGALSGGQRGLPQDVEPFAAMDERLITGCAPPPRP